MEKFLITFFLIVLPKIVCFGQSVAPQTNLPSPNIASLGVFGEFPAVSATGVPNISLNLYTVSFREVTIPITLQYNSNLAKPDQHPGWVGLGWNLTSGGAITRIVNDVPDEDNSSSPWAANASRKGYFHNQLFFSQSDWSSYSKAKQATDHRWEWGFINQSSWVHDSQPDEFSFSFLNYSGTFYLNETGQWKVRSESKLDVTMSDDFRTFTLIDQNGTQFVFGSDENAIEYTSAFLKTQYLSFQRKSWNLSKIVAANGDVIQFIYERGETILNPQCWWHYSYATTNGTTAEVNRMTGSQILPSYLRKIVTPVSEVEFERSNSVELPYTPEAFERDRVFYFYYEAGLSYPVYFNIWQQSSQNGRTAFTQEGVNELLQFLKFQQLDRIQVKRKSDNKVVDWVEFVYSNSTAERLKLRSFNTNGNRQHQFFYTSDSDQTLRLPPYLSGLVDKWGFFNGRYQDYSSQQTYFASKEPNEEKLQAELLKRIVYPTRGFTDYEFEPHTYSKEVAVVRYSPLIIWPQDKVGGGVRIKTIKNFDSDGELIDSRAFKYTYDYTPAGSVGSSSGILGGRSFFTYYPPQGGATKGSGDMFARGPLVMNNNGSIISYSMVTEVFKDGGYIQRKYSNFDNGIENEYMDAEPIYRMGDQNMYAYSSKSYERGRLLDERTFKVENNIGTLVSEKEFRYLRINQNENYLRAYDIRYNGNSNVGITDYRTSAIKVFVYPYVVSSIIETIYDQFDQTSEARKIVKSVDYDYKPIGQFLHAVDLHPRRITVTEPSGEKIVTECKLVNDYPPIVDAVHPVSKGISKLREKGVTSAVIESITYLQRIENFTVTNYYITGRLNTFKIFPNGNSHAWETYSLKFSQGESFLSHAWSNLTSKSFSFAASKYRLAGIAEDYDLYGNPISVISADGLGQSISWVHHGSLIGSLATNPDAGNLKHELSYTHEPLVGVKQMTDQNGRNTNYIFDVGSRLRLTTDHENQILSRYVYRYKNEVRSGMKFSYSTYGSTSVSNSILFVINGTLNQGSTLTWDFGDGSIKENSNGTELKEYFSPGYYDVKLAITYPDHPTSVTSKTIRILPLPIAQFTAPVTGTTRTICGSSPTTCSVAIASGPYQYQWEYQYSASGTANWLPFGNGSKTANFSLSGVQGSSSTIRCKVSDPAGNFRYSDYLTIFYYCSGQQGPSDCQSGWSWNGQLGRCEPPQGFCSEGCFWDGFQCVCY
ncbi:MAG: hypothetical protein JNL17_07220 [Cyclobacteriaceae bacterium]|nr:hypothetical protein [Cyclobacteriaceae bacterium]